MKLAGYLAGEKDQLHKLLDDSGIKFGCVVSDINGVSAKAMIEALIEGKMGPEEMAKLHGVISKRKRKNSGYLCRRP
jgi:transposase